VKKERKGYERYKLQERGKNGGNREQDDIHSIRRSASTWIGVDHAFRMWGSFRVILIIIRLTPWTGMVSPQQVVVVAAIAIENGKVRI